MSVRPIFILHLRPEPDVANPTLVLRLLLKAALRVYGLRCLKIEEQPAAEIDADAA